MPDNQNTDQNGNDLLDLAKKAIMEELSEEFNEELDKTYLDFVDKMDNIKRRHQEEIAKLANPETVTNSSPNIN